MAKEIFIQKLIKYIKSPKSAYHYIFHKFTILIRPVITDKLYLKLLFFNKLGQWPDLDNPKTFNEKLQWLKLHDHNPEYTIMADKVKAKEWVAKRIGWEHIIPTLGVWEKAEDIDFDALPDKFVIKCNHNSGTGMYICKDKSKMNKESVRRELAKGLKEDYYADKLEWPYKNIPRRILAEQFMENNDGSPYLTDYKFFCFNGEPMIMYLGQDYSEHPTTDFFDMNYNSLDIRMKDPNSKKIPQKPKQFKEMQNYAKILSKGVPHLRVDFYCINGKVYFGELTFYHNAGLCKIHPQKWENILGNWIHL